MKSENSVGLMKLKKNTKEYLAILRNNLLKIIFNSHGFNAIWINNKI